MNTIHIKELLQKRNLKATSTRVNLLKKMGKFGSAMSHSDIQKQMKPVDRVTLYRTIETLKEKGIIHRAFQENNETYYAICGVSCDENDHRHEHVHFKCSSCNTIKSEELKNNIEILVPNHQIHKISVNIEGLCENCL